MGRFLFGYVFADLLTLPKSYSRRLRPCASECRGVFRPQGRCYSLQGFFKGWHCSYNAWLVRYMYIPLGGTKYRLLNIWPIFFFVAVWHDLEVGSDMLKARACLPACAMACWLLES